MTVEFVESGLKFGPYPATDCYIMENTPAHNALGPGVKMVEFALSTDGRTSLWLVEAKSSVPSSQNSPAKYEEYFKDIEEKMVNAVTMLMMGGIQRDKQVYAEFPDTIKQIDWSLVNLHLRLIITPVPKKFLPPLQDSLRKRLSRYLKLWGVNQMNLKVINGELAQQAPFNAEFVQ